MRVQDCFKIGYIAKLHGLKGGVRMALTAAVNLGEMPSIFLERDGTLSPYFMQKISQRGDDIFIQFEDVDTIEEAQALRGCSVYLPKTARPALAKGEYYDDELIGFAVQDNASGTIGVCTETITMSHNVFYKIEKPEGKEILLPKNAPFIQHIDWAQRTISVLLPDGFLAL